MKPLQSTADEVVSTPMDRRVDALAMEGLRRRRGGAPSQPAMWAWTPMQGTLEPEPCLGRYPKGFLEWAIRELGVAPHKILHVCTGGMSSEEAHGGLRLDLRSAAAPDVIADGRALPFLDGVWDAVMIDPPYSVEYAKSLYGVEYPRPSHLLREAARVVKPGGQIAILHFIVPVPPKGTDLVRVVGITQGLGYRIRAWTIYRRQQAGLFSEVLA